MDSNKEFDNFQSCLKNFNTNVASTLLSDSGFITSNIRNIIPLLGEGLSEDNFKNKPDYFDFCEEQLVKMAQSSDYQETIFDFLELIDMDGCKLSSSVIVVVTLLENTKSITPIYLEYLLISTFNSLNELNNRDLKEILMTIIQHLMKLYKHFQHEQIVLYYFARVAFLILRANIDPIEFVNIFSIVINDPFCLLELEFEEQEEKIHLASFFYLYFKTGMQWGPKIYNRCYVLEKCFHLALSVFENNDFGKSFAKLILTKFKDNTIPLHLLNKCHELFCMEAAQSSMYNENLDIRKDSIESLMLFINKLCSNAQYIVCRSLFSKSIDSGIIGELIIRMKELIIFKIKFNQELGYFQGTRLLEMIRLCCNIPNGSKCNVVENKEHILAAISFVYVLHVQNYKLLDLGIAFTNSIKLFVITVQNAIDNTKDLYKFECKKLSNKVVNNKKENNFGLPELSEKEKQNMLSQFNTTIALVQLNLDMLKLVIKD